MRRRDFFKSGAALSAGAVLTQIPLSADTRITDFACEHIIENVEAFIVRRAIFVKVTTADGLTGWGEASPNDRYAAKALIERLKEFAVGSSVFDTDKLWHQMLSDAYDLGPGGVLSYSMAGIDCALWDLKGKILNVPVWKLLGGKHRDKIKAYASYTRTDDGRELLPSQTAAKAANFVNEGFKAVKLRLRIGEFNTNPENDSVFDHVREIRKAIGDDVELMIDANNGYTVQRAINTARKLYEEYDVKYFEEPVSAHHYRDLAEVSENTNCYIVAGEHEYNKWMIRDLIFQGKPDIVNPDVIKSGGVTEAVKMAAVAQAFNKPVMLHSTRPTLGTATALNVIASIENAAEYIEYSGERKAPNLIPLFENKIKFEDGYLIIPDEPGLGLNPIEDEIKKVVE